MERPPGRALGRAPGRGPVGRADGAVSGALVAGGVEDVGMVSLIFFLLKMICFGLGPRKGLFPFSKEKGRDSP